MVIKRPFPFGSSSRTLHIYLPEGYDFTDERYPVMYFFDGHNLFSDRDATYGKCWGLKDYLDKWNKRMIAVGLECNHEGNGRLIEYCPYHFTTGFFGDLDGTGDATMQWIVNEVKPMIDENYRTYPFREATGIAGSSMGGLMSLYAAIRYNHVFSKAGCLSSAIGPGMKQFTHDIVGSYLSEDTRVFMSWGTVEAGGTAKDTGDDFRTQTAQNNLKLAALMNRRGVNTRVYCQRGGRHCEADWEKQLSLFMPFLWQDR